MKTLARIAAVLVVLIFGLKLSPYAYLFRGFSATYLEGFSTANIYDRNHFDQREMPALNPMPLRQSTGAALELSPATEAYLQESGTAGLVVLRDGEMVLERYFNDHADTTLSNSFSSAKSVITLLVQIAIQDGYISSWDDPITDYLPDYEVPAGLATPTLRHLSTMTAGLNISENYKNPLGKTARLYYGDDVYGTALSIPPGKFPTGEVYEYQSASTQLLTNVLSKAVGESVSSYANRELFGKLGFESKATWHLDQPGGLELGFCCLNAATRDFAKLGELARNYGKIGPHSIIDSAFMHMAVQPYKSPEYGHSFWLYPAPYEGIFAFRGMLGQFIIVDRANHLVLMRTGQKRGPKWEGGFWELDRVLLEQMAAWTAQN